MLICNLQKIDSYGYDFPLTTAKALVVSMGDQRLKVQSQIKKFSKFY